MEPKCQRCRGTRYIPAGEDNAWKAYFRRTGQGHHHVLIPCPVCGDKSDAAVPDGVQLR
jgi:hypothetical protein